MQMETQNQAHQKRALALKQKVCELLGWDELSYAENQYSSGLQYLQHYIPKDPDGIDQLAQNKIFWNWWKVRWADRDEQFCNQGTPLLMLQTRLTIYQLLHNPKLLANEIYPNGVVLSASYAVMIKEVIKEEVL